MRNNERIKKYDLMWFQHSRAKWFAGGDWNTKYYHLKTVTRRRKNKILMLQDEQEQWIDDDDDKIKHMVNDYYKNLFSSCDSWSTWSQTQNLFPRLNLNDIQRMDAPISNEEIKEALFEMKPWKASGSDGLPTGFYQRS